MPKGIVENNGDVGGEQFREYLCFTDTVSTSRCLTEKIREKRHPRRALWNHRLTSV